MSLGALIKRHQNAMPVELGAYASKGPSAMSSGIFSNIYKKIYKNIELKV